MQKTLLVSLSLAFACASTVATFSPVTSVAFAAEDVATTPAATPDKAATEPVAVPEKVETSLPTSNEVATPVATPDKAAQKKAEAKKKKAEAEKKKAEAAKKKAEAAKTGTDAKTNTKKKTADQPAKKDPKMVNATFKTNMGDIKIAFNKEKAPLSVAQFEMLIKEGFYKGIIFHRVISGFMIQAGGMEATMAERKTTPKGTAIGTIKSEAKNGLKNKRGAVALARTADIHSATSQFYICLDNKDFLDDAPGRPGYTVIGEVTAGMDVVDKIAAVPTQTVGGHADVPKSPIIIESATLD